MFFDIFNELCKQKGVTKNKALVDCGISRTAVAKWKNGSVPNGKTLSLIANYFNVPISDLLGDSTGGLIVTLEPGAASRHLDKMVKDIIQGFEPAKDTNVLTKKDTRDIARDLERIMADLESGGDLMFDGDPLSEEAKESIRSAMKLGLEAAKLKNKERFTPKKYQKD